MNFVVGGCNSDSGKVFFGPGFDSFDSGEVFEVLGHAGGRGEFWRCGFFIRLWGIARSDQ